MKDLLEALTIFSKYANLDYPTNCTYDIMQINPIIEKDMVSDEDIKRLEELGFTWCRSDSLFHSFKFGSC